MNKHKYNMSRELIMRREKLAKVHELSDEIAEISVAASDNLKTAQDRTGHVIHKMMREGQEIEITEKLMWDEVFYLGHGCESGKILRKKHKEVFELYDRQSKVAIEMKTFCIKEFGMDFTKMSISDYLRLTEAMFNLLESEKLLKTKK